MVYHYTRTKIKSVECRHILDIKKHPEKCFYYIKQAIKALPRNDKSAQYGAFVVFLPCVLNTIPT